MTNLEKIQSMDVVEMAVFLTTDGFNCNHCMSNERCPCDQNCFEHCQEWLEREAGE